MGTELINNCRGGLKLVDGLTLAEHLQRTERERMRETDRNRDIQVSPYLCVVKDATD